MSPIAMRSRTRTQWLWLKTFFSAFWQCLVLRCVARVNAMRWQRTWEQKTKKNAEFSWLNWKLCSWWSCCVGKIAKNTQCKRAHRFSYKLFRNPASHRVHRIRSFSVFLFNFAPFFFSRAFESRSGFCCFVIRLRALPGPCVIRMRGKLTLLYRQRVWRQKSNTFISREYHFM